LAEAVDPQLPYLLLRHGAPPAVSMDFGGINVPEAYREAVAAAAARRAIPPRVLAWLLNTESGFNPKAVGPPTKYGRALGIAQFMPSTARSRGVDPLDPVSAIEGAAAYLAELTSKHGGLEQGLARYGTFSTGRGAAADAAVRAKFRRFYGGEAPPEAPRAARNLDAGTPMLAPPSGAPEPVGRVPYYPEPEDLIDPVQVLWNAYSQDDNLTRILRSAG
jgi:hypothetical protein